MNTLYNKTVNRRKLKLKMISQILSVGQTKFPLQQVKRTLRQFKEDIGNMLSINHQSTQTLTDVLDQERFLLEFEKMTIQLELVRNRKTRVTTVKDFIMN